MKTNIDQLTDRIEQEIRSRALILELGSLDDQNQMDAAMVTRDYLVKRLGIKDQYVPTVGEIRANSIIYNRVLELLNEEGQ